MAQATGSPIESVPLQVNFNTEAHHSRKQKRRPPAVHKPYLNDFEFDSKTIRPPSKDRVDIDTFKEYSMSPSRDTKKTKGNRGTKSQGGRSTKQDTMRASQTFTPTGALEVTQQVDAEIQGMYYRGGNRNLITVQDHTMNNQAVSAFKKAPASQLQKYWEVAGAALPHMSRLQGTTNRTADLVGMSEFNESMHRFTMSAGMQYEARMPEAITSMGKGPYEQSETPSIHAVQEHARLYTPKSTLLQKAWKTLENCIRIEYADGKVVRQIAPPSVIRKSAGSQIRRSAGNSQSDMRSLRSREAALIGSRLSLRASDHLLQESLRESIERSLKESARELDLPVFKRMCSPKEASHSDDFATGLYIGQINPVSGKKEGLGVRIYLSDKWSVTDQDQAIPPEKIISIYEGEWKDDLREGKGFELYSNKDVYVGMFHANQRQGKGKMIKNSTGETYTGEWYQGMRHGYGAWNKANSEFHYSGMWSNNKPWGYGILKSHLGDVYEGLFKNGFKHGTGVESYKGGGSYIGNFRDGQPEGHGKLIGYDGSVFEGQFRKGQKHGKGKWTIPIVEEKKNQGRTIKALDGPRSAHWSGTIENGMVTGSGVEVWSTGIEYRGDFKDNARHGRGRMLQRDGTVYEGGWSQGKASGYGVLIQPDGFKMYGLFKDNLMVQKLDMETFMSMRKESPAHSIRNSVSSKRCKSAKISGLSSHAQLKQPPHKFSRRPMMNKLMNALVSCNSSEMENKQRSAMTSIKFQFRHLGVNAQANNYAFANDCYSQAAVSPIGSVNNFNFKRKLSHVQIRPQSQNQVSKRRRFDLSELKLLEGENSAVISIDKLRSEQVQKEIEAATYPRKESPAAEALNVLRLKQSKSTTIKTSLNLKKAYSKLISPAERSSRGIVRVQLQRTLNQRSTKNTLLQKDIEELKSLGSLNQSRVTITNTRFNERKLILPEQKTPLVNDFNQEEVQYSNKDTLAAPDSNVDLAHALSLGQLGQTLANSSNEHLTIQNN